MTAFWNGHKKLKKIEKKWKTFASCHCMWPSSQKNNKLVIRKLFLESVLRNELASMKIHGFQAKWSILWRHSWHSLFKWSHIVHKGASWNGKKCCQRKFSFSLHRKFIFHFSNAPNEGFLWRNYQIIVAKMYQINFIKYQAIYNAQLTKWLGEKSFDPPLVKKAYFHRFSWKRVKFEL